MNILIFIICITFVPLLSHSNKKSQEDLKNGIMRALEIRNQNSLLAIAFPALTNGLFGLSTNMCATIMLQRMRDSITENSSSSLKIIRVIVSNIRQVKTFTRIICDIICAEEFILFYSFICWIFEYLETWFIKTFSQIVFKLNALSRFSIFENCLKLYFIFKEIWRSFSFSLCDQYWSFRDSLFLLKLMNHDISAVGLPHTFRKVKNSCQKICWGGECDNEW